jgi:carbamoyl-phosphate synthase large subunit
MKKLLILGASAIQVPIIVKAKELGFLTLVVDFNPEAPGMALADKAVLLSTNDIPGVVNLAMAEKIDGILTTSDFPVRTVAAVGEALSLPVLSPRAAEICTDKYLQRELLAKAGLPCPRFLKLEAGAALTEASSLVFPVIVKPVDSSASRGVQKVRDRSALPDAVAFARSYSRSGAVIVEEFVHGREFSVEVLIQDGAVHIPAITEKTTSGSGESFFVEVQHVIQANLTAKERAAILGTVETAVLAAGLDHCASHTEVMLTAQGVVIIEIAARLGGDFITSDLVPLATGVDMGRNVIRMALGEPLEPQPLWSRFSGIQFITPDLHPTSSTYLESIQGDHRVVRWERDALPGGPELRSSLDRSGYLIAVADSRESLSEILDMERNTL